MMLLNPGNSLFSMSDPDNNSSSSTSDASIVPRYGSQHTKQKAVNRAILQDRIRRAVLLAGRRAGKTTGFSQLAVDAFAQGWRVLYAAPTIDQTEAFFRSCKDYLVHEDLYINETKRLIEHHGSGANAPRIRAKTAYNSQTLRGDYGTLIILDEYQLMKGTLDDVVLPMLLDHNGTVVYGGTPDEETDNQLRVKYEAALKNDRWLTWNFPSHENPYLSKEALETIADDLTVNGYKREILAEFTDEVDGALWTQKEIDDNRVFKHPQLVRVAVAVDPASWSGETGIFAGGVDENGICYLLEDATANADPDIWGGAVVATRNKNDCDLIVYEKNQGGKMVETVIKVQDPDVFLYPVHASRGKVSRAEPVKALYKKGMVKHVGYFKELEYQMTTYKPGEPSPDRMDAMVWLVTFFLIEKRKRRKKPKTHRTKINF